MRDSNKIAQRMELLDASGIRKVFDLAAKMKDPINFSIGQPNFDVPEVLKKRAIDAIGQGLNRYTQTQGTAELRAAMGFPVRLRGSADSVSFVSATLSGAAISDIMSYIRTWHERAQ